MGQEFKIDVGNTSNLSIDQSTKLPTTYSVGGVQSSNSIDSASPSYTGILPPDESDNLSNILGQQSTEQNKGGWLSRLATFLAPVVASFNQFAAIFNSFNGAGIAFGKSADLLRNIPWVGALIPESRKKNTGTDSEGGDPPISLA